MSSGKPRVAVLISGEGTNLQALIDAVAARTLAGEIALVVSNRAAARGLERARAAGIPTEYLPAERGAERAVYDRALGGLLDRYAPDVVVLAGFMRILTPEFVARFLGRLLNLHPSLLPKYPGLDTHRLVLENADALHGATVHFVTAELDAGPGGDSVSDRGASRRADRVARRSSARGRARDPAARRRLVRDGALEARWRCRHAGRQAVAATGDRGR